LNAEFVRSLKVEVFLLWGEVARIFSRRAACILFSDLDSLLLL